jgi:hypothetical protein
MEDNKIVVEEQEHDTRNFDLTSFARAKEKMIATNEMTYKSHWDSVRNRMSKLRDYTPEEVAAIIESGSLIEQQKLSRNYFYKDGYYKRIIIYYATLLKYMGLLIPNPSVGKNLSTSHIQKRYYSALDYVERMQLPVLLTNIAQRALVEGCYYGLKVEGDKNTFQLIDLPVGYACSRFKDIYGNDIVEFDVSYFGNITDVEQRNAALAAYPKIVQKAWKELSKGKRKSKWLIIPKELGVCFPFFDGRPLFLNIIPATIEYDEAVATQRERDAEEIRKIIVQKIPHLNDGRLLFEPDEAEEIHHGTVGMMKGNKNVSVLTTYGDVDAITSSATADKTDNTLTRMEQNIYAQAGVTGQVFASTGSSSLETSLNNDLALMMYLANKFSRFITNTLNDTYGNGNITFKYQIMPITYYNATSFADSTYKLVGSGYSALLPALAFGLTQKDLVNIKDLENDVLKLGDKLKPLSTSYTQSNSGSGKDEDGEENGEGGDSKGKPVKTDVDEGGRPKKKEDEKADKTHQNEESLDRTGGGS